MGAQELLMDKVFQVLRKTRLLRTLQIRSSPKPFTEYFKGFEKIEAVKRIFGNETEKVLQNLKVEFTFIKGYMWVNDRNGHLVASLDYLNNGDKVDIYLDVIHELVHVKQFMEGKELFDHNYSYVERPTEIEAYRFVVDEARRIGLSDERICQYLKTEWMSNEDLAKLTQILGIKCGDMN